MSISAINKERAVRAENALAFYEDTPALNVIDLLTDLQHFCYLNKIDFDAALQTSKGHYAEESGTRRMRKGALRSQRPPKHTPGPWWFDGRFILADQGGDDVYITPYLLEVVHDDSEGRFIKDEAERAANGRLAAAALTMLAALKHIQENWTKNLTESMKRVNAAIDEAEGRA